MALATACGDSTDPSDEVVAPALPPVDDALLLGAAGAPLTLFGPVESPTFASAFQQLSEDGFNRFVPIFLTSEAGGTDHPIYFFPADAFGLPMQQSCEGTINPWAELPEGFKVVFPANVLAPDPTAPLDRDQLTLSLRSFVSRCLDGDKSKMGGAYLQDEPALSYISGQLSDPPREDRLQNVEVLSRAVEEELGVPTLIVEGPIPLLLRTLYGLREAEAAPLEAAFWDAVDATAPHADQYGFDIYAVDLVEDLSVIPDYIALSKARAPNALPLIVLEGAGYLKQKLEFGDTLEGREPTRDETRAMAFLSIIAGARGLYWYGLSMQEEDSATWADVREVVRDLRAFSGVFSLPPQKTPIAHEVVHSAAYDGGNVTWILLANPSPVAQTVLVPEAKAIFDAATKSRLSATEDGELTLGLAPYGTAVLSMVD